MNNHTSPCDHMTLFVAKSSPERTWVPRCVTGRLTVRRLVNINLGRPRTSSTAAPRKPQHHRLWSSRSESKSFFFLKNMHGVKRAIQEAREGGGAAAPTRRARGGEAAPARGAREGAAAPSYRARGGAAAPPEEVSPPTPAEVKSPLPEEVKPPLPKEVKPPRCKVVRQHVAAMCAPPLTRLS
jgi:hypothetical protein